MESGLVKRENEAQKIRKIIFNNYGDLLEFLKEPTKALVNLKILRKF